jgi:ribonucleoside-diphosphate reductase beta chain
LWREHDILRKRCESIAGAYQNFIEEQSLENYLLALVSDYILEGIYFYAGFMYFYTLASRSLMPGTADIIKLIHRDELSHVRLYQELVNHARKQYPDNPVWQQARGLFITAASNEISWNTAICQDNILGITTQSTTDYVYYLTDIRLRAVGVEGLDIKTKNPYQHLERFSDLSDQATTKTNFFEATVTSYQTSSTVKDWDF